jgi:hypothetical protein
MNEIKQSVLTALNDSGELIINHNNAEEFDFMYLQLLMSLLKTAMQLKKKVSTNGKSTADFVQAVKTSGLNNDELFSKIFLCEN